MRKGYLVALPPGAGKTLTVLKHLMSQVNDNLSVLCKNLIVVGPNKRVSRVWLRELNLLIPSASKSDIQNIRKESETELKKRLAKHHLTLDFLTFGELSKLKKVEAHSFVVIDEWHRYKGRNSQFLVQSNRGPLGNHTYLVSATPLNPVMEQERDTLVENPMDDVQTIRICREKALELIADLTGIPINEDILACTFKEALKRMRVKRIDKSTGWKIPLSDARPGDTSWTDYELEYFDSYKGNEERTDWKSSEAAWAIGLIRTKKDKTSKNFLVCNSHKGRLQSVFGHHYANPYVVESKRYKIAAQWLWKGHSRVQRLLDELEFRGVIKADPQNLKSYVLTKEKVLIFCVHQGVARGLQFALEAAISTGKSDIACSVHEFTNLDENQFMQSGIAPYILIATDKLSESIDLHGACHLLVHYELPWSPLRLLQRVGRLTRMHGDKSFKEIQVCHVIIPGSVEEERVNRLVRRTELLHIEGAWPKELNDHSAFPWKGISKALIGGGPSMHLLEICS